MKSPLLSLALLALITALLAFTFRDQFQASYTGKKPVPAHYQQVIRCSPTGKRSVNGSKKRIFPHTWRRFLYLVHQQPP